MKNIYLQKHYPTTLYVQKKLVKSIIYSTVGFVQCNDAFSSADLTYNFTFTYRHPFFTVPLFSEYQFFLYETIIEQRNKGKTFDQIA